MPFGVGRAVMGAAIVSVFAAAVASATRTTWDGVFTADQAMEGETAYQEHCSMCHGPDLEGGEDAPPLAGAPFSVIWEGRSLGDLVGRMRGRMPKGAPGSLGRDVYTNIAGFLLSRNGFPSGSAKLPSDAETLNAIRYVTAAP